jgi:hypothetical protein
VTRFGILVAAATFVASSPALAERPRPTYVLADPELGRAKGDPGPTAHNSNVIYLNGCFQPGDCVFQPSEFEDSVTNQSSIIGQTSTLSPFNAGQTAWAAVVDCVQRAYKPFNVVVTDQDPSPAPHFEAVVAGDPAEVGFPNDVGGVAPFNCSVINNAITYSFANIYQGSLPEICWTVAQESAHAFGLDHSYLCEDPMTYLTDCGPEKWFRNKDAACGELQERACMCEVPSQNSYQFIRDEFGAGTDGPPVVSISAPVNGASVNKGFSVTAQASDDIDVDRVELWINNQMIQSLDAPPFTFVVPPSLADGVQMIQARAYDVSETQATASVQVTQGAPCASAAQCLTDQTCVDGRCVLGPGAPGGLGQACVGNDDCASGQCGDDGEAKYCAEVCEIGGGGCPDGFGCREAGNVGVCWPGYDDSSGCRASQGGTGQLAAIALGLMAALFAGRRRRRR